MIYAFAQLSIRDRDTLGAYRAKAAEALARHGGTVVAAGPATLLEGDAPAPDTAAPLGFPHRAAALAWIP
ncbi:MAG: DUF1330 domain-containing protein, partial [Myxococcales bacterium]|nr:DUF1330 domain-containing protein [Myxococcales bacterium]